MPMKPVEKTVIGGSVDNEIAAKCIELYREHKVMRSRLMNDAMKEYFKKHSDQDIINKLGRK